MRKGMRVAVIGAAVLGVARAASEAAVLHVTAQLTEMTDAGAATGATTDPALILDGLSSSTPHDFKITYFVQVDGLTGEEQGFGNLYMNLVLPSDGLSRSTLPAHANYEASNATANAFGVPGAPIFSQNGDVGVSATDWHAIVASTPAYLTNDGSADDGVGNYRWAAISGGPVAVGSVWTTYTGGAVVFAPDVPQWSVAVGEPSQLVAMKTGIDLSGASVSFFADPGPGTTARWVNPAGGAFSAGANWSLGVVPGASQHAIFDTGGAAGYTVTVGEDGVVGSMAVRRDDVTLDLGGHDVTVSGVTPGGTTSVTVGGVPSGALTVVGTGGTLRAGNGLAVGASAGEVGTLNVLAGGKVSVSDGYVGSANGATGSAVVSGAGSSWVSTGSLHIGRTGAGDMSVLSGGWVSTGSTIVGTDRTGNGQVTVDGAGSTWETAGMIVGQSGVGTLNISNGGVVRVTGVDGLGMSAVVGGRSDSWGTVTVRGGARWEIAGPLHVGGGATAASGGPAAGGRGIVHVQGGTVSVGQGLTVWNSPGTGVDVSGGTLAVAGGIDLAGPLTVTAGTVTAASVTVRPTGSFTFHNFDATRTPLSSTGVVEVSGGRFTAPAQSLGGTFRNHGTVTGPTAAGSALTFTGPVSGTGSFTGRVAFADSYSPGDAGAVASVSMGSGTFFPSSTLRMDLGMPGASDHIAFASSGEFGGALAVSGLGSFAPAAGQSYDLFDGSLAGRFSSVSLPSLPSRLSWDTSSLYDDGTVNIVGDPTSTNGAILRVMAHVTEMSDPNATTNRTADPSIIESALHSGAPHDYKITYSIKVDGLSGSEAGFGNLAMNIQLPGDLKRSTAAAHKNYFPSGAMANEYGAPAQIFSIDGDQGTSPTDLQGIVASVSSGINPADGSADDGVRNYSLAAINDRWVPIGDLWVTYDGGVAVTLAPDVYEWSESVGNPTQLVKVGADRIDLTGAGVYFPGDIIPEPTVALGAGPAAMLWLLPRRRQRRVSRRGW